MKVKLLLQGEGLPIPKLPLQLGLGFVSVWIDNNGFHSATNELGTLGYLYVDAPEVDIGEVDDERQRLFTNLHGCVVTFDVRVQTFLKDGGTARVLMSVPMNADGAIVEKKIEFLVEDCHGLCLTSSALSFSTTLYMMDRTLAQDELQTLVDDKDLVALADAAPASEDAPTSDVA